MESLAWFEGQKFEINPLIALKSNIELTCFIENGAKCGEAVENGWLKNAKPGKLTKRSTISGWNGGGRPPNALCIVGGARKNGLKWFGAKFNAETAAAAAAADVGKKFAPTLEGTEDEPVVNGPNCDWIDGAVTDTDVVPVVVDPDSVIIVDDEIGGLKVVLTGLIIGSFDDGMGDVGVGPMGDEDEDVGLWEAEPPEFGLTRDRRPSVKDLDTNSVNCSIISFDAHKRKKLNLKGLKNEVKSPKSNSGKVELIPSFSSAS